MRGAEDESEEDGGRLGHRREVEEFSGVGIKSEL